MLPQADSQNLIFLHTRRLQKLKEKQALYGISADPSISLEIEQIEAELENLRAQTISENDPTALSQSHTALPTSGVNLQIAGDANVIYSNKIRIDKVGDTTEGDTITVGNISGSTGIAIGRSAQASVTQGVSGDELSRLFVDIYQRIETAPPNPNVDKADLTDNIQKIQQEIGKGEQANPGRLEYLLKTLALISADIFDVTVACLISPAAGITAVIREVVQKAKGKKS